MYALVKTGGKQYRVSKDDTILVERLPAEEGEQIILSDIVMLGDGDKIIIGTPRVDGAGVSATVVRQTRGPKIIIFRRKRRKNHRRTQGHRQDLTLLKINEIAEDAKSLKTTKPAAKETPKRAAPPKAAAAKKAVTKKAVTKKAAAKKAKRDQKAAKKAVAEPKAAAKKAVTKKAEPKAAAKKAAAKKATAKN